MEGKGKKRFAYVSKHQHFFKGPTGSDAPNSQPFFDGANACGLSTRQLYSVLSVASSQIYRSSNAGPRTKGIIHRQRKKS